ncbi:hypothetical protein JW890_00465 [candidate division WOR-3 bacterium]|nr:hypothetical protein [candidate division WOR-3 bacterium]
MKIHAVWTFLLFAAFTALESSSHDFASEIQILPSGCIYKITEGNSYQFPETYSNSGTYIHNPYSGIIWHYSVASGLTGKNTSIGNSADQVFAGTWYGGSKMFTGTGGFGTPVWETPQPSVGANEYWRNWASRSVSSASSDLFYSLSAWEVWDDMGTPGATGDDTLISKNFQVSRYSHSSSVPIWTWDGTGYFLQASVDEPGKTAISGDGSVLAVTGLIDGHLAVMFFSDTSSAPVMIYENPGIAYSARQVRLTSDGSTCIFSCGANLYRVEVATGNLAGTHSLGASTDCFGVSGDGSIVSYGFTSAYIAQWNGTNYGIIHSFPVSSYYAGSAVVSQNGNYAYFGFYRNDYLTNRIYCYDLTQSAIIMTYNYPIGSGTNQDIISWLDCSDDGRWLAAGSWGCQTGGGPEIQVFDNTKPTSPVFTIDTPGSVFHVDISPDGQYISSTGKHVHANTMGSGIDLYFAEIDILNVEEENNSAIGNNGSENICAVRTAGGMVKLSFSLPFESFVTLDIFDAAGRSLGSYINAELISGNHEIQLRLDVSDGVYFYELKTGETFSRGKFFLAK